ncbi:MAG TPA: AMP-binding protein, partial [Minicystis sp.]|nr:AMP-binding protein [Minicystis sp.]
MYEAEESVNFSDRRSQEFNLNHQRPFATVTDILRARADDESGIGYTYLNDGERDETHLSYASLDVRARAIAAALQAAGARGERAVLLYPPDLGYVAAFFGAMYAGAIAVPAYPPDVSRLNRSLPRLQAIVADCSAEFVLTTREIVGVAEALFAFAPELQKKRWVATDDVPDSAADAWTPPPTGPETLAFLQYTSGSTGSPKGVMLSHGNLLANLEMIARSFGICESSVGMSWLPPYHDMGLIGGLLAPLYKNRPSALMSPLAFLQRPSRWLHAITRFRATTSGGPNFAYELCARRVGPEERASLDLSSWTLAFSGAEPIRPATLRHFVETFAPCGFSARALFPCYGLAEATLIVSGGSPRGEVVELELSASALERNDVAPPVGASDGRVLVGCGEVLADEEVTVVDPLTLQPCSERRVGEVWVRGASVAGGYWNKPKESAAIFGARVAGRDGPAFLRTGDLGFVREGHLFVTGRLKDLVIVRGRNHYPQDIEHTVEECSGALRRGCSAVFAVGDHAEDVVIAVELERRFRDRRRADSAPPVGVERRRTDRRAPTNDTGFAVAPGPEDLEALCEQIRQAVMAEHAVSPKSVVLLKAGTIPKTSSGKIQRHECKRQFLNGELEVMHRADTAARESDEEPPISSAPLSIDQVRSIRAGDRHAFTVAFLQSQIQRVLRGQVSRVSPDEPLSALGLDSLMAVDIAHEIERTVGAILPSTAFLGSLSINEIARRILATADVEPVPAPPDSALHSSLSYGQEALWFLHHLDPDATAYNVWCAIDVSGRLEVDGLDRAFEQLATRHPVLTTRFESSEGRPVQRW